MNSVHLYFTIKVLKHHWQAQKACDKYKVQNVVQNDRVVAQCDPI